MLSGKAAYDMLPAGLDRSRRGETQDGMVVELLISVGPGTRRMEAVKPRGIGPAGPVPNRTGGWDAVSPRFDVYRVSPEGGADSLPLFAPMYESVHCKGPAEPRTGKSHRIKVMKNIHSKV